MCSLVMVVVVVVVVLLLEQQENLCCLAEKGMNSHVVLNELLDFVAGELLLAEHYCAVLKLVAETWWAEQFDSPGKIVTVKNSNST